MTSDDRHAPYLNPNAPIDRHSHRLPHWQQGDVYYFVTWHLGDALPRPKLEALHEEKIRWLAHHPRPWDSPTEETYHALFTDRVDKWLDPGYGSCILRDPTYSHIVGEAIHHFDGERYTVDSFVVMPNHVHTLFLLLGTNRIEQIVKSWKGYSAREINRMLRKSGALWQEDYWDRILRTPDDLSRYQSYIERNPSEARLKTGEYLYFRKDS